MDQGSDLERRLVAYRHARYRLAPRRTVYYLEQQSCAIQFSRNSCALDNSGGTWPSYTGDRRERKYFWCDIRRSRLRGDLYPGFNDLRPRRLWETDQYSQWHVAVAGCATACASSQ